MPVPRAQYQAQEPSTKSPVPRATHSDLRPATRYQLPGSYGQGYGPTSARSYQVPGATDRATVTATSYGATGHELPPTAGYGGRWQGHGSRCQGPSTNGLGPGRIGRHQCAGVAVSARRCYTGDRREVSTSIPVSHTRSRILRQPQAPGEGARHAHIGSHQCAGERVLVSGSNFQYAK